MPKIVDHDRYRKELLVKSFDLFAEKGYAAITMRQIAQGLGVSTGTLYHYFPSKEALFEQLLEEMTELNILSFSTQLEAGKTLEEQTEMGFRLIEQHREFFFKQTLLMIDYYQYQRISGKDVSHLFKQVCERSEAAMFTLLGIDDPDLIVFITSLTDGLILQEMYGHKRVNYETQARLLSDMLMMYLEKHNLECRSL
jgi:AcrR family transcriptional regulator